MKRVCYKCGNTGEDSIFISPYRKRVCNTCDKCREKTRVIRPSEYPASLMAQIIKCNKCARMCNIVEFISKKTNAVLKSCADCRMKEICEHYANKYHCEACRRTRIADSLN